MRLLAALLAALLITTPVAAQPADGWQTVRLGRYVSFEAPPSLYEPPGFDAYEVAGLYDSDHFGLTLDYGRYGSRYAKGDEDDGRFARRATVEKLTIDGRPAVLLFGPAAENARGNCSWIADLYVTGPTPKQNLYGTACGDDVGLAELKRLYHSIRFGPAP